MTTNALAKYRERFPDDTIPDDIFELMYQSAQHGRFPLDEIHYCWVTDPNEGKDLTPEGRYI